MHDDYIDEFDKAMRSNSELSQKLQHAESRNANLQMELQRMKASCSLLVSKLDIANGEIGRLAMLLRHNARLKDGMHEIEASNARALPPMPLRQH